MAALQSIGAVAGIVYPLMVLEAISPNQDVDKAETLLEPGGENPLCLFQRDWLYPEQAKCSTPGCRMADRAN